jgi:membrane-associated phospholipid phosphatase
MRRLLFAAIAALAGLIVSLPAQAQTQQTFFGEISHDFQYGTNNFEADLEDILTSPIHLPELFQEQGLMRQPAFYYTLIGVGAVFGGAFALDPTMRSHLRSMASSTAGDLETGGEIVTYGAAGLLYFDGLFQGVDKVREDVLTGAEGAALGEGITYAFKYGFGRLRPYQGHGSRAFFNNGRSFISGETTPVFAFAAATSEFFDNAWYVLIPSYAAASAVGIGRMGHDAHFFSDVTLSAMVGISSTELLLWLHKQHAENPSRFRIFPVTTNSGGGGGVSYSW